MKYLALDIFFIFVLCGKPERHDFCIVDGEIGCNRPFHNLVQKPRLTDPDVSKLTLSTLFLVVASSLQLSDCKEFKLIPPEQYDKNVSSLTDITKRPLGYMYAKADYPTVQSEVKNPCFYVRNLTSRNVEVMVSTGDNPLEALTHKSDSLQHHS